MNSLRIDLILEHEQRSTSPVSVKFVLKTLGGLIAAILILVGISFFITVRAKEATLSGIVADLDAAKPQQAMARKQRAAMAKSQAVLEEIEGWQKSRMPWQEHFVHFQKAVPANIELTYLRIEGTTPSRGGAARAFTLTIRGVTRGQRPESDVARLIRQLTTSEGLAGVITSAKVTPGSFKEDSSPDAKPYWRQFAISAVYKPRLF